MMLLNPGSRNHIGVTSLSEADRQLMSMTFGLAQLMDSS